ncbi:MAG: PAS domain S-box protein [Deltaproteobacteria bacterium]|nr:PAS domain S-box protein [Deltaproteobacteria bacterium]MBW2392794.1 PAS domain S-box protein [Deltaproteobacteria bacterium]
MLPARVLETGGPEARSRARLLAGVSILLVGVGAIGAWVAEQGGNPVGARLSWLATFLWALPLPTLWLTRSNRAAASWIPLGVFLDLAGQATLVWGQTLSMVFLFVVPLAAVVLIGIRDGWGWVAVVVLSAWPLAVWQGERLSAASQTPLAVTWSTIAFTAAFFGVAVLGEMVRSRAVAEAESARRAAEATSRHLEVEQARFRALSDDSFQTIVETDRDGIVLYVNPRFESVLGYSPDEMLGRHPAGVLAVTTSQGAEPVESRMESGRRYEIENRHRDGSLVWQEVVASRYRTQDGEERWIFAGRDITREREERERLRAAEKLESLGVLAGGVAHDFNNLLTVIAGYADVLDASEPVKQIRRATQRAASLTGQHLAFGRQQVLKPRRMTLDGLVTDLKEMLKSLIREEVSLELRLDAAPWAVDVDPSQIQRVLVNLASNARDAMPDGGSLRIETSKTEIEGEEAAALGVPAGEYVRLVVADTGTGMAPETLERAFEPFFTTKEVGEGTGLGLASVYGIVEQSHGGIQLSSTAGLGTEVALFFPRVSGQPVVDEAAQPAPAPAFVASGRRVLLVEDEESVRRLVRDCLRRDGFEVVEAADGPAALREAARGRIDLLISDVVMPEMRGPELAARLRSGQPELPVLFVSGYSDRQLDLSESGDVPTRFLAKPFSLAEMRNAVYELVGESEEIQSSEG